MSNKSKIIIKQELTKRNLEEKRILEKYPKIFRQKDLPMTQTCMCWGLEIGYGWMKLMDKLCANIQKHLDKYPYIPQVEAEQVKEKFGGLRFYYCGGDKYIYKLVWRATNKSYKTCEECGKRGKIRNDLPWISTLCTKHYKQRKRYYAN